MERLARCLVLLGLTAGGLEASPPPRCVAPATASGERFTWPDEVAVGASARRLAGARPLPVLQGDLVSLRGPGLGERFGPLPTWDELVARIAELDETHRRQVRRAEEESRSLDGTFGDPGFEAAWETIWKQVDHEAMLVRRLVVVFPRDGEAEPVVADGDGVELARRALEGAPLTRFAAAATGETVVVVGKDRVDAFRVAVAAETLPRNEEAFEAWFYVRALLAADRPLYAEPAGESGFDGWLEAEALEEEFDDALERSPSAALEAARVASTFPGGGHPVFDRAAAFAESEGECDLARSLRARYRPTGMCSMDNRPADAAVRYAALCHRMGDLSGFLRLQLLVMGDRFDRVAWSSYGEAVHDTGASRLEEAGIDLDRFLTGLVFSFDAGEGESREIGWWRLGRSIVEGGRGEQLAPRLASLASDTTLDPFNRLQATAVLAMIRAAENPDGDRGAIRRELSRLALHPLAEYWVDRFGIEER